MAGSRLPDGGGESHHFTGNQNPGPGRLPAPAAPQEVGCYPSKIKNMLLGGWVMGGSWKDFEEGVKEILKSLEEVITSLTALKDVSDDLKIKRKTLLEAGRKETLVT